MWGSNGVGVRLGGDLVAVTKVVSDSGCKMTMYGKGVLFAGMEKVLANHGLWFLVFFFKFQISTLLPLKCQVIFVLTIVPVS